MDVRIGITTSFQDGEQRLKHNYVEAVARAGGIPIPVPMLTRPDEMERFVALLDGLVVTGGPAVEDGLVGDLPDDIEVTHPTRTAADRLALDAAEARGLPILGICYGMQLVNARAGGRLLADVERMVAGTGVHSSGRGGTRHGLRIEPGTHLARLLPDTPTEVGTWHVQAVTEPGEGFRVAARADDGTIEAVERSDGRVIAVQFHPERELDVFLPLFENLVALAAEMRNGEGKSVPGS